MTSNHHQIKEALVVSLKDCELNHELSLYLAAHAHISRTSLYRQLDALKPAQRDVMNLDAAAYAHRQCRVEKLKLFILADYHRWRLARARVYGVALPKFVWYGSRVERSPEYPDGAAATPAPSPTPSPVKSRACVSCGVTKKTFDEVTLCCKRCATIAENNRVAAAHRRAERRLRDEMNL